MASGPVDKSDLLGGISNFVTKFQDLLQQKQNVPGSSLSAADTTGKATSQWGNFVDNQWLALVSAIEDGDLGASSIASIDTSGFSNVQADYKFEGDLTDASTNGYDLKININEQYPTIQGKQSVSSRLAAIIDSTGGAGTVPNLAITGALTVHCLVYYSQLTSSPFLFSFGGVGETEATNVLYSIEIQSTGVLRYFAEYSGGINIQQDIDCIIPNGRWTLVTLTRNADGKNCSLYLDGYLITSFATANAPSGGSSGYLLLSEVIGLYGNLVILSEEQDASTVTAVATQVGVR